MHEEEARNKSAVYVLLRTDNKIFLLLRENTGFMDGYYTLPAGRVNKGEGYKSAAVREAAEESGVKINPDDLLHFFTANRYSGADNIWTDVYFQCAKWEGVPMNAEASKHSWAGWVDIDKLPINMMEYQKAAIMKWVAGETYTEIGF